MRRSAQTILLLILFIQLFSGCKVITAISDNMDRKLEEDLNRKYVYDEYTITDEETGKKKKVTVKREVKN